MPGVYQLSTSCHNGAGNFFQNTFHYELTEAGSGVSPFTYADELITQWIGGPEAKYLDCLGADVSIDFYTCKKVTAPGGPSAQQISGAFGTGALSSASSGMSMDIQWQSANPNNRPGHTYIPAFPYSFLQGDVFLGPAQGKAAAFVSQMQVSLTLPGALGTAIFCIFTRKTQTQHQVNSGKLRPKATMMNRRLLPQV